MFQSFSGNSRRPRNVNLSGRNTNPFAQSGSANLLPGSQNALVAAQQNRLARQQERERAQAVLVVQRSWKRYSSAKSHKQAQRSRWDVNENRPIHDDQVMLGGDAPANSVATPFSSEDDAFSQLRLLVQFLDPREMEDLTRLHWFLTRMRLTLHDKRFRCAGGPWPAAYLRLQRICLKALTKDPNKQLQDNLIEVIRFVLQQLPPDISWDVSNYYRTLGIIASHSSLDLDLIKAPLQANSKTLDAAYDALAHGLLERAELKSAIGGDSALKDLAEALDSRRLGEVVATRLHHMKSDDPWFISGAAYSQRLWLLTHIIFIYRHASRTKNNVDYMSDRNFVYVVGTLLSSLVNDLVLEPSFSSLDSDIEESRKSQVTTVDTLVRDQICSLVTQKSVTGLLTLIDPRPSITVQNQTGSVGGWSDTRLLANYILTLLRLFPRSGDEIRMWLYLGSSSPSAKGTSSSRLPVIRYFWEATARTSVFSTISRDPREAIALLKPRSTTGIHGTHSEREQNSKIDDEWRIILIFIELYMFVLRIMDDEQFFSSSRMAGVSAKSVEQANPLRLSEIEPLTLFLKILGFTMYYNASDILDRTESEGEEDLRKFFKISNGDEANVTVPQSSASKSAPTHIAGVHGMTIDHVRGLVTGLMRAIYERDSRRPFLPKDHWLMTSRFNMTNFIDSVVEEEIRRNEVPDDEDENLSDEDEVQTNQAARLVGTGYEQRRRRLELLQRQRRKTFRKQYLQKVAPRQEILSNLPFFIPFTTRVQIFRRFVYNDQMKQQTRFEPDFFGMASQGNRHHAKIRREHEFEDAYDQFYELGAALKNPIRITFVDQFDTVEAGIDGGGVTKEFLTSVTSQAFAPNGDIDMFVANEQQLLYPNPSAVEEKKELLREIGIAEGSSTWNDTIRDLLRQYEFLGRIIGKCLYEGILIDVGFAGFFLLKWALTGGDGSAARESGYRANINDLRDFDEGLYQGLIQLKNYTGDVEDFSLNFTVTDTVKLPSSSNPNEPEKVKNITRDLIPSGTTIPVTNANRLVYISYVARHRLQIQPQAQTSAFLRGLSSIIQPSWLSMFNQTELQTLVGGAQSSISVPDLRANTVYGGVYVIGDDGMEHPSVQMFWQVMEEMEQEDRRKVLKFVTSTPRAPLLGFGMLNPRFSIRDAGGDESRLPSTSTCVNLLKLPRYSQKRLLRTKLLQAVNSGAGFDLS